MDEEPFDSYHECTLEAAIQSGAYIGQNQITAVYCQAGIRLPHENRLDCVERVPPYISYYPERRLLLRDGPGAINKKVAHNGQWKFGSSWAITRYWRAFTQLLELLHLPSEGETILEKISSFTEYINNDGELRAMYHRTFPDA